MKKFAISLLALVVAAMFVQASQASEHCITFTNFCDKIDYYNYNVKGIAGNVVVGLWDWQCDGTGTPVTGTYGPKITFDTQPVSGGVPEGDNFHFAFQKSTGLFDLYVSHGGITILPVQTNEGWSQTSGACSPLNSRGEKPRAVSLFDPRD